MEEFAASNGLVLDPEAFQKTVIEGRRELEGGSEHSVYIDQPTFRVIKLTHPDLVGDGKMGQSRTAATYLEGLELQNKTFGTDIRLEGVVRLEGAVSQVVISQPYIKGCAATLHQIGQFMEARGFRWSVKEAAWVRGGLRVSDVSPANVMVSILRSRLVIIPFDVQIADLEDTHK